MESLEGLFEQLGIRPDLVLVNAVSFLLLLWLLRRFLFKPVSELLDQRSATIEGDYKAAERAKAEMEQLRADYEAKLADVATEAREKIAVAINEGQAARQQILAEARDRAEGILKRGEEELARERDKLVIQLREQVVDLAVDVAGRVVARTLDDQAHRGLVREFIEGVGGGK